MMATIEIYFMAFKIEQMNIKANSNWRQTHYLLFILPTYFNSKSSSIASSASSFITLWMHFMHSSSISTLKLKVIKLILIANWIFKVSDFSISIMIPFKYGLILLQNYLTDIVFITFTFVVSIIVTPINIYCYWFINGSYSKTFLISLIILNLNPLFSFWSLKMFLISLIILSFISLLSFSSLKTILMLLVIMSSITLFSFSILKRFVMSVIVASVVSDFIFPNLKIFFTFLIMFSFHVLDFLSLYVVKKY